MTTLSERIIESHAEYFLFDSFKKYGCIAGFSRGRLNLGFQNNPDLRKNRESFLRTIGIKPDELICLKQVHGNKIFLAKKEDKGRGALDYATAIADRDGIITREKELPLAVFSADCLSVFMLDVRNNISAVIHAGWRGSKEKIALSAINILKEKFFSNPEDIICGFGPCMRNCCYEVSEVFQDYFPDCVEQRRGKFFLDLIKVNSRQLLSAGVLEENISDSQICTSCRNDEFFSYREEGQSAGRMMSVIMIK